MRIGILTDFPSASVQSGPALHTRFLHDGMKRRGHEVLLIGPDTGADAALNGEKTFLFKAIPYPTHPKVKISWPSPLRGIFSPPRVDVIHGQTNSHMSHYASWMREMWQIPVLNTHTIHLPTHCHFLLSDRLWANPYVRKQLVANAHSMERNFAQMYNDADTLIVQSRHFVDYWRERGVTVPIEVVGRPINPKVFSVPANGDPFPSHFPAGKRLMVVCRHDREKRLDHLIRIFASRIAPNDEEATLTIVGDGFDHKNLVEQVWETPYADRIHFPGEARHGDLKDWYGHADLFVYTSLSETFGNVINEALWCGLPVVALDDGMGVAHQVADDVNGYLIAPNREVTDDLFAGSVLGLLADRAKRRGMAEKAANLARRMSHPDVILRRFEGIYEDAREHCRQAVPHPLANQGRIAQMRAFSKRIGTWAWYNGLLLAVSQTATRLGASRNGEDTQHAAVVAEAARRDTTERTSESRRAA